MAGMMQQQKIKVTADQIPAITATMARTLKPTTNP